MVISLHFLNFGKATSYSLRLNATRETMHWVINVDAVVVVGTAYQRDFSRGNLHENTPREWSSPRKHHPTWTESCSIQQCPDSYTVF